jgi:hypothetical protein
MAIKFFFLLEVVYLVCLLLPIGQEYALSLAFSAHDSQGPDVILK